MVRHLWSSAHSQIGLLDWTLDKWRFEQWSGLSDDVLHVHAGLLLVFLVAVCLRQKPWHWAPWLVVVIAETVNEIHDLTQTAHPSSENTLAASWHDFWLTLLWPTVMLLAIPRFLRAPALPPEIDAALVDTLEAP